MKNVFYFVLIVLTFCECKNEQRIKAKIFERKEANGNKLKIKYNYSLDGKTYFDSAIVNNVVMEKDTISITVQADKPYQSKPDIENK